MQPFKPYFRGEEEPPSKRLTSCQKCFRTTDIENVGLTERHLTFFEMLGNFSIGDYFKQGAVEFAYELATQGFGFEPDDIWTVVFAGDEELGLGPRRGGDRVLARAWGSRASGSSSSGGRTTSGRRGRPARAGPARSCTSTGASSSAAPEDRPGDDTDRFLEVWNLVFMQYELHEDGSLTDLPAKSIDTGLGLERLAAILQDVPSVFETDHIRPLVALGEELSGRSLRRRPRHHPRAADPGRPRPGDDLPARRRRGALERGPRLHPAADHAPRHAAGPGARDRAARSCRSCASG